MARDLSFSVPIAHILPNGRVVLVDILAVDMSYGTSHYALLHNGSEYKCSSQIEGCNSKDSVFSVSTQLEVVQRWDSYTCLFYSTGLYVLNSLVRYLAP